MQNILTKISDLADTYKGKKLELQQVILYQRKLKLNNLPTIPKDYIKFLYQYNSLIGDNFWLFGINPRNNNDMDIIFENIAINHPNKKQCLILGFDDVCYFTWNQQTLSYQLIDKSDFEVLNNYQICSNALIDFLGLNK